LGHVKRVAVGRKKSKGVGCESLKPLLNVDIIIHVVRAYADESVVHYESSIDPVRDLNTVNQEILLMVMCCSYLRWVL
jgi:ribosome-binding ATPase YchF (GTP1/OBG family)